MSRSNPTDQMPHPCTRWFEWDGERGTVKYYDKTAVVKGKEKPGGNIAVPLPFSFLVLDELAIVKGWHERSESGIVSNEVRDTRTEAMVVKAFNGGVLASGFYADIRDKVHSQGGRFTTNIYLGFKEDGVLKIGSLQFKGGALSCWMDFKKRCPVNAEKKCREYHLQAVKIGSFVEGKKGSVVYRNPVFGLVPVTDETNVAAAKLDFQLQEYLKSYLDRTRTKAVPAATPTEPDEPPIREPDPYDSQPEAPPDDAHSKPSFSPEDF